MTAHRLNHHDIQAIEAFNARARKKAKANRRADRITLVGSALALVALVALGLMGGLSQ
ncbi:hypothetical protein ACQ858_19660 [Variovorax ureilyticus]|uniref:hypothetical protein n=1 Tax=Variovorax ureilyticus TaxID=1836198 RepID=UPI003D67174F